MTDEQKDKQLFVTGPLTTLLIAATGGFVDNLRYEAHGDDEVVYVTVRPSVARSDMFGVNVSCDSKWAIAKDVMAAVAVMYE